MAPSRRAPDLTNDLKIDEALALLLAALLREDPSIRSRSEAFMAAGEHLTRCQPEAAKDELLDSWLVPAKKCRACGEAIVIKRLVAEQRVSPIIRSLYGAIVSAQPRLHELIQGLDPALRDTLRAFDARDAALAPDASRPSAGPAQSGKTAAHDAASGDADERWMIDALEVFDTPLRGDETGDVLRRQVTRFARALLVVSHGRVALERRLLTYFASYQMQVPKSGAGRPSLDLLKQCARMLRNTGHGPQETARLLPTVGTEGAAARIREHTRKRKPREDKTGKPPSKKPRAKK